MSEPTNEELERRKAIHRKGLEWAARDFEGERKLQRLQDEARAARERAQTVISNDIIRRREERGAAAAAKMVYKTHWNETEEELAAKREHAQRVNERARALLGDNRNKNTSEDKRASPGSKRQLGSRATFSNRAAARNYEEKNMSSSSVEFMSSTQQEPWEKWMAAHLEQNWKHRLVPAIGEALGEIRYQLRQEFENEIASLRKELAALRADIGIENRSGEIIDLPDGFITRRQNAA